MKKHYFKSIAVMTAIAMIASPSLAGNPGTYDDNGRAGETPNGGNLSEWGAEYFGDSGGGRREQGRDRAPDSPPHPLA